MRAATRASMDEFLRTLAERLGIPERTVRDAMIELLTLLRSRSDRVEFGKLLTAVPGSAALLATQPNTPTSVGNRLQRAASLLGTRATGPLDATGFARRAGLDTAQIGPFVSAVRDMFEHRAGAELTGSILDCVPELGVSSS
jgi:hypothetical protein